MPDGLSITGFYLAILAVIYIALSIRVVQYRAGHQIDLGDGGDDQMQRRIRCHGNFQEYVPVAILLMGFAEAQGTPTWLVQVLGIALVVVRLAHVHGIMAKTTATRVIGTSGTWLVILVAALTVLWPYVRGWTG